MARGYDVEYRDALRPEQWRRFRSDDPFEMDRVTREWQLVRLPGFTDLPDFTGGWVGFAGYDTVSTSKARSCRPPRRTTAICPTCTCNSPTWLLSTRSARPYW